MTSVIYLIRHGLTEGLKKRWFYGWAGLPEIEEGFEEIANTFKEVAEVEKYHANRYSQLITNLEKSLIFERKTEQKWHCLNCGYIFTRSKTSI